MEDYGTLLELLVNNHNENLERLEEKLSQISKKNEGIVVDMKEKTQTFQQQLSSYNNSYRELSTKLIDLGKENFGSDQHSNETEMDVDLTIQIDDSQSENSSTPTTSQAKSKKRKCRRQPDPIPDNLNYEPIKVYEKGYSGPFEENVYIFRSVKGIQYIWHYERKFKALKEGNTSFYCQTTSCGGKLVSRVREGVFEGALSKKHNLNCRLKKVGKNFGRHPSCHIKNWKKRKISIQNLCLKIKFW